HHQSLSKYRHAHRPLSRAPGAERAGAVGGSSRRHAGVSREAEAALHRQVTQAHGLGNTIMLPISWILPRARAMFPDRLAIWDGDVRHSFEHLGRRVDALAGAFKANGLRQGDRVAILDVNSSRYAEAYYACA